MTTTLLFDLDETLLDDKLLVFLPAYLQKLSQRLSIYTDPGQIIQALMAGTRAMVMNKRPDCTLEEVFDDVFFPMIGRERGEVQAEIDAFYTEDFPKLKALVNRRPDAIKLVEEAFKRSYQVAIATSPLFPATAILQRLEWAGLPVPQYPFALVPSYQAFHFSKPSPAYYAEFLGQMGWPEGAVVMIGNDPKNDIEGARQLGLPVFWISEDKSMQWTGMGDAPPQGGLSDLLMWLDSQPSTDLHLSFTSREALIAVLRSTPAVLATLCKAKSQDDLLYNSNPGEWSVTDVLCHLRDMEIEVNLRRLDKVMRENNPFIPGEDTDPWAAERNYNRQNARLALSRFTGARIELVNLLESLQPEDWERPARHAIFGPTRLRELIEIIAGHDRLHVRQVYNLL